MLIRRKALEVFDIAPRVTFDCGLALFAAATGTGRLIDDVTCVWRRHPGVVTTAFSNDKGYVIEKLGKWRKWYCSLWLMARHTYFEPVATTMENTALICNHYGQHRYAEIARDMSKQKPWILIRACWKHAWLIASLGDFRKLSLHDKIGNWCYQFCYPAIWWYDYHTHKSL